MEGILIKFEYVLSSNQGSKLGHFLVAWPGPYRVKSFSGPPGPTSILLEPGPARPTGLLCLPGPARSGPTQNITTIHIFFLQKSFLHDGTQESKYWFIRILQKLYYHSDPELNKVKQF